MVDVKMSHDEVLYRLARNFGFDSVHDGYRPFLEKRSLDDNDVILHLDCQAVMCASFDLVDALATSTKSTFCSRPKSW